MGLVKRTLASTPGALDTLLEAEADAQALCFGQRRTRQAVQRFFDKQPPALPVADATEE